MGNSKFAQVIQDVNGVQWITHSGDAMCLQGENVGNVVPSNKVVGGRLMHWVSIKKAVFLENEAALKKLEKEQKEGKLA